jgi:hypothetical protein
MDGGAQMLLDLWEAALRAEVGIAIPTDNRSVLRQHLYKARAEANDPRFDKLTMIMPQREDEIWLVHKDADSIGAFNQSDVEPLR